MTNQRTCEGLQTKAFFQNYSSTLNTRKKLRTNKNFYFNEHLLMRNFPYISIQGLITRNKYEIKFSRSQEVTDFKLYFSQNKVFTGADEWRVTLVRPSIRVKSLLNRFFHVNKSWPNYILTFKCTVDFFGGKN